MATWAVGKNDQFQLGALDNQDKHEWTELEVKNIKYIQDGVSGYCVAVTKDGFVFCCGNNEDGQLGLGNLKSQNKWVKNQNLKEIDYAACGYSHTLFLFTNGDVFSCGKNDAGQIARRLLRALTFLGQRR